IMSDGEEGRGRIDPLERIRIMHPGTTLSQSFFLNDDDHFADVINDHRRPVRCHQSGGIALLRYDHSTTGTNVNSVSDLRRLVGPVLLTTSGEEWRRHNH